MANSSSARKLTTTTPATTTTTRGKLPTLPRLPKGRMARNWNECACGCGGGTQSTYVAGHDGYMKGVILRYLRGQMDLVEITEKCGEATSKAVETHLADKNLVKRWNLGPEVAAFNERIAAEANAVAEADADDDTDDADEGEGDEAEGEGEEANG